MRDVSARLQNQFVANHLDDAYRLGIENRETLELARRHCLKLEFVESGGRGMLEAEYGLPINMRQVRCPVALGSMAMNLRWIGTDFVREHCNGCQLRESTGELPNLATVVAEQDAKAAQAADTTARELEHERVLQSQRLEVRNALKVRCDEVMAEALSDLSCLDPDPTRGADPAEAIAALARLQALADRTPEHFTAEFVSHATDLVAVHGVAAPVIDVLRRLGRNRAEFSSEALRAAFAELRRRPSVPAGRCLADLLGAADLPHVDDGIVRSAILLAGEDTGARWPTQLSQASDPTALLAVTALAPERVGRVLAGMFPPPPPPTGLVLPTPTPAPDPQDAVGVASAAQAARVLASTHPAVAGLVVGPLLERLKLDPDDDFGDAPGLEHVERALAIFLVLDIDGTLAGLRRRGTASTGHAGDRLVRVLQMAGHIAFGDPRWRVPGDPVVDEPRQAALADQLLTEGVTHLGGDWGDSARSDAAELLRELAGYRPEYALTRLAAYLGGFVDLLDSSKRPAGSPLTATLTATVQQPDPQLRWLTELARVQSITSAINKTLEGVEALAKADPAAVCRVLVEFIQEERDAERGTGVRVRLIKTVGNIAERHGGRARVLQAVVPMLHTYIVGSDIALQVRALDAWSTIGGKHPLPSSLSELLPALARDPHIAVAMALARATVRLRWNDEDLRILLYSARRLLIGVDAREQADAVKAAASALKAIATRLDAEVIRTPVELSILGVADALNSYDLRDALGRPGAWSTVANTSPEMARLRLRQAADPQINDRWNRGDDDELCDLLECGPGLVTLPIADLTSAGVALGPDGPVAALEFVEVAWRAGRIADADTMLAAFLEATPTNPSHAVQRQILEVFIAAVSVDAAAVDGSNWDARGADAETLAQALAESTAEFGAGVLGSIAANLGVRRALSPSNSAGPGDPAAQLEARAIVIADAGDGLESASTRATPTCRLLRAVASACQVAAHLVRSEAAAFDARTFERDAHWEAARRRAEHLAADLRARFTDDDPLAGPLITQLDSVGNRAPGAATATMLNAWATLPLPVPVVTGPRRRSTDRSLAGSAAVGGGVGGGDGAGEQQGDVAVALASLDGRLVTGPEVMRGGRVYELSLRVHTDDWPEWADRLDAEFLSRLTAAEITVPEFTWRKGDTAGDGDVYEKAGPLVLRFALASGQRAVPVLIALTWRGTVDGAPVSKRLDVSGHRELRLRPYDESRDRLTDFPVFDERLLALYERLAKAGYDADQLQAFCRLMTAICRAGLSMTWEKKFRRGASVTERQFHDELHRRLVEDPELGGRVDRGNPLALGFLDVRHDGITAELKVERKTPVTEKSATKYIGQPTQYAAADGARLSILTVLDMSPKVLPVGTPENYLFVLEPQHHGLTNPEAPSLVAVLIVNGNLPTPSSWSRRRTPTRDNESPRRRAGRAEPQGPLR